MVFANPGRRMEIIPVFSPASPQATAIVDLFYVVLAICAFILLVVTGIITLSLVRFRAVPGQPEPRQTSGNLRLEAVWTLIPLLLVIFMFVLTARSMSRSDPAPDGPAADPELVITGHQWWWEARYTKSGAVAANEIHIPIGQRWLVELDAADVIHDFWAPRLGRKMDMIPGRPNEMWLEAAQPGTYLGSCAEYCGTQHAWMRIMVVAQTPAEFEKWEQRQLKPLPRPNFGPAGEGAKLFEKLTCANCHAIGGAGPQPTVAPELAHVAERRTLGAGVLLNTPANLFQWLKDPQAIKPGCLMPNLNLSDQQVSDLLAFLEPKHD